MIGSLCPSAIHPVKVTRGQTCSCNGTCFTFVWGQLSFEIDIVLI